MAGLFGSGGELEQLFLWGMAQEVIGAMGAPMLTALAQDMAARHPLVALTPQTAAEAVARHLLSEVAGAEDAARGGIDPGRFRTMVLAARQRLTPELLAQAVERHLASEEYARSQAEMSGLEPESFAILRDLAKVRLAPSDLAEAVLRSYLTRSEAEQQAAPQGISAGQLGILADLAGDAPGPQEMVTALFRGIVPKSGHGAGSTSYEQGIAESRLHNKWAPVLEELGRAVLSPADAASAVVRNFLTDHEGQAQAAKTGVDAHLFDVLRHLAGDAPAPGQLAEALRRGAITEHGTGAAATSFTQGIAEGRLADKWAPVIKDLAKLWPTPVQALDAALKGQISKAEGRQLYERLGGDPQFYDVLLHSQGEGPTPLEAADWARRGIIPWAGTGPDITSYEQAVKESRFRDKWAPAYKVSSQFIPTAAEVVSLYERHAIDQPTAAKWLAERGLTQEQTSAYIQAAAFSDVADTRGLTVNAILTMFYDGLIDDTEAGKLLRLFAVPEANVSLLLAMVGVRREITNITAATSKIRSLVAGRKVTAQTARDALARLHIPGAVIDSLVSTWQLEASVNVKTLTEAQIVDAWQLGAFTEAETMAELQAIGYTEFDAWALMSIKAKKLQPGKPARDAVQPPPQVAPGVT